MPVKINSFGGPITWTFRKHCSYLTSKIALSYAAKRYKRVIDKYIYFFEKQSESPLFLNCMIETLNRCNGSCSFCPANKHVETRPFKKMTEKLYHHIIDDLFDAGWKGTLYLSINNEPFVDTRILDFAEYAKRKFAPIGGVFIELITNGTLLSSKRMYDIIGKIDKVTINDYSSKYRLSEPHKSIYKEIKTHREEFKDLEVVINRRYSKEILATRAGYAPNKKKKNNNVTEACIYPFTDILVFPDGKVGMCCNDCKEISGFGDVTKERLVDIWNNEK